MAFYNSSKFVFLPSTKKFSRTISSSFGMLTVLVIVIILALIINCSHVVSFLSDNDPFTVNITMKNFETTKVYI